MKEIMFELVAHALFTRTAGSCRFICRIADFVENEFKIQPCIGAPKFSFRRGIFAAFYIAIMKNSEAGCTKAPAPPRSISYKVGTRYSDSE
jgi:hypothetical protein